MRREVFIAAFIGFLAGLLVCAFVEAIATHNVFKGDAYCAFYDGQAHCASGAEILAWLKEKGR